jgi:hypothetical protein
MPRSVTLLAFLALLAAPSVAAADVCVDVDEARDALPEADRAAARMLLERQLIGHGRVVAATPEACTEHWTVAHIALGGSLTISLDGDGASQTATVASVAELGRAYEKMLDAMLAPPIEPPAFVDPEPLSPVPAAAATHVRAPVQQRRGTIFARVGYGVRGALGGEAEGLHGTTFGAGYRRSTASFGFEISALNLMLHRADNHNEVVWDSFVRLAGFAYIGPKSAHAKFVGAAFGYGDSTVRINAQVDQGWFETRTECGPHLDAFVGGEILSSAAFHVDAMLNVILPLYSIEIAETPTWSPGLSASLSVGF